MLIWKKVRIQKTEFENQNLENRTRKTEFGKQNSKNRIWKTEFGKQNSENRNRKSELDRKEIIVLDLSMQGVPAHALYLASVVQLTHAKQEQRERGLVHVLYDEPSISTHPRERLFTCLCILMSNNIIEVGTVRGVAVLYTGEITERSRRERDGLTNGLAVAMVLCMMAMVQWLAVVQSHG